MRSYTVYYESEYYVGFRSCLYGELTTLKNDFKNEGKKITEIEYLKDGVVIDRRRFH